MRTILLAALALGGCAQTIALSDQSTAVTVASELRAPGADDGAQLQQFLIGPTDEIAVSVFGATELDRAGVVDSSGEFALPLIGSVKVGGLTPTAAAANIADRLRGRYIKDPQVVVTLKEIRSNVVTVDGAVKRPGLYPVVGSMTLQQVIARAEGANDFANTKRVVVFRTVDGTRMAAMFDLKSIRSGQVADPSIYGRDVVVVGESAFRRFLRDSQVGLPMLARFTPLP